jgi:hypothetical protein
MLAITQFALEDARAKGHDMERDTRAAAIWLWVCLDCGRTVQESSGVIYGDAHEERCGGDRR